MTTKTTTTTTTKATMMNENNKKKIMVVSNNHKLSQRLKFELEIRKVFDLVDISHVNGAGAMKPSEKLMLEKECGKYNDYELYIIDDSINKKDAAYDFAQNLVITYKDLFHIY